MRIFISDIHPVVLNFSGDLFLLMHCDNCSWIIQDNIYVIVEVYHLIQNLWT